VLFDKEVWVDSQLLCAVQGITATRAFGNICWTKLSWGTQQGLVQTTSMGIISTMLGVTRILRAVGQARAITRLLVEQRRRILGALWTWGSRKRTRRNL
jgi:hypothetical protein